jgi:hypothetical protein
VKEPVARRYYGHACQGRNVRFEERAREFILLAKVNPKGKPQGNQQVRSSNVWDDVLKVRGVSRIRPEAGRSMRGQVEV